jgi:tRNA (Thr-GGU) A37 N-methylase
MLRLNGTNVLHKGERVWKMMSILVSQLKFQEVATLVHAKCFQTVDEIAAAAAALIKLYHSVTECLKELNTLKHMYIYIHAMTETRRPSGL